MTDTAPTPDEVRALLRECVTIVRPGEILVIRVPYDTPWDKAASYQRVLDAAREAWGFRAVVVTAEEFGVVPEAGDEAFAARVMSAINALNVRATSFNGAGVPVTAEPGSWVGGDVMPAPDFIGKDTGNDPGPIETGRAW